ncbi:amino acid-binding protein [Halodesulfurarchaeum sp. HSR-GB]|uniref:amino acid-binding protein n=1 Tax=Halodesulfurarchaeum sp. HSR-GB TaxID=3074077 RepID=UPI0028586284|nr:amino acid-binding protein [Halodesulfurarchaeum sp. HSR-GB]MDR5656665.1 amino acid-binding protein [Halodesulfurarchaeum sp. HSR-GB]
MSDEHGSTRAHTVRLELVDEPGELLRALEPIAENGGNLLSIFHERGSVTPRGRIPVEIDLECAPEQLEQITAALRDRGINVIQAGTEKYGEEVLVLLIGARLEEDLSATIERIESETPASVIDLSLSGATDTEAVSSGRFRLALEAGAADAALDAVRQVATDMDLRFVAPLVEGSR